jgi:hypothetical protein
MYETFISYATSGIIKSNKLEMSVDIVQVFSNLRDVLKPHTNPRSARDLIKVMGLTGYDEYLAMKTYSFIMWDGLDYDEAYELLGKERVDEWMKMGTFADSSDPIISANIKYWVDPEIRQLYYEEYIAKNTTLRRTDSGPRVKLHPNFTIAEIEYEMRKK